MKPLSPRGNLVGIAVCAVPTTLLSIVVVGWWLDHPGVGPSRLVELAMLWLALLLLSVPVFAMLAVFKWKERKIRIGVEVKLADIKRSTDACLVELHVESERKLADLRKQRDESTNDREQQLARRNYFTR